MGQGLTCHLETSVGFNQRLLQRAGEAGAEPTWTYCQVLATGLEGVMAPTIWEVRFSRPMTPGDDVSSLDQWLKRGGSRSAPGCSLLSLPCCQWAGGRLP